MLFLMIFFFDIWYFSLLMCIPIFYFLNFSWLGFFILIEGSYNYFLFLLSFYIFYIIYISELDFFIIYLSLFLLIFSLLFFFVCSFFYFYIFFELSLVPILMLILSCGNQIEKINSSYYLIFYSMLTTFPFLFVYFNFDVFLFLIYLDFIFNWEFVLFLTLGFMMKFPIYILHFWLPKAHVESPSSGSMLLAGLLLKFGTMGFIRFLGCIYFLNLYIWFFISFLGMILCCFICMIQSDSKSLVAYSSIVHMSFLMMCFMIFSLLGKISSFLMMLAHGFVSVIIFYLVGEFYHSLLSRLFYFFNSFLFSNFFICLMFSMFFLLNSGLPPSLSFFSEFLGLILFFNFLYYVFYILFLYFFLSFYYSLFVLINLFIGKNFLYLSYYSFLISFSFLLCCFNFIMILNM